MGVLGLWQLLDPTARQIKIEGLEGKIIAIDISIWLHQATKGSNSPNSHITVLFNRICKLLYYKIKPIFVFDGPEIPPLKRRVLQERQNRRQNASNKTKELDLKLQKNFLETYALSQILGDKNSANEFDVVKTAKGAEYNDDLFKLKDFDVKEIIYDKKKDELNESLEVIQCPDINEIDKEVFDSLPIDIQIELLTEYKEKLKRNKGAQFEGFPENTEDFSSYQMKMLLKKGDVSKRLNDLKQSIKTSIANDMDIPMSSVIHEKIASEDDREILLISRKNTEKFATFKNMLEREFSQKKSDQDSSQSEYSNSEKDAEIILKSLQGKDKDEIILAMSKEQKNDEDIIDVENDVENDVEIKIQEKIELNLEVNASFVETKEDGNNKEVDIVANVIQIIDENEKREIHVLKRHLVEKENQNLDVSPPKNSKFDTKTIQLDNEDYNDTDDDDFEKVVIPDEQIPIMIDVVEIEDELKLKQPNENVINDSEDDVLIINEMPTTSEQSVTTDAKNYNKFEGLIENSDINLDDYHEYLKNEKYKFLKEKQHESKLSNKVESYMIDDAKFLLDLFGLPYITSPSEAEAQCAFLDFTQVTDGSITEDSDIWLFGATNVYKNFFNPNQYIEHYSSSFIKSQLGLDRESFINIALLVGSDYTTGVEGVGIVKAMEILNEFEGEGLEKLINLKKWHDNVNKSEKLSKYRNLLRKLILPNDFPSKMVHEAYMNPNINKINKGNQFNWGFPDLDLIRKYLVAKLAWDKKKVDDSLLPIFKRMNETKIQKTIDNYFSHEMVLNFSKQSKRMKNAINLFKSKTAPTLSTTTNETEENEIEIVTSTKTSKLAETNNSSEIEFLNLSDEEIFEKDEDYKPVTSKKLIIKPKTKRTNASEKKSLSKKKK